MKVKNKQLKSHLLIHKKLLALSVSALCTGMVVSSSIQASDIDVYQQAKAGDITLMMLFDISGSMGAPQLTTDADACGISVSTVYGNNSVTSTNGTPTYTRYYCTAKDNVYFYKVTTSGSTKSYFKCNDSGSLTQSSCTTTISSLPTDYLEMSTSTSGSDVYYYKKKQVDPYYDRITRLKDAMFDLLNGNSNKGISAISDDKVIGLSAFSFNGLGGNGFVLVPARKLGDTVTLNGGATTQRAVLLNAVANKLYARGGTPTGNAYAEVASYLLGTKTFNNSELSSFSTGAPVYFTYVSNSTTYYTQCNSWDSSGACTYWPGSSNANTAARAFNFLPLDLSQYSQSSCTVRLTNNGSTTNQTGTCYNFKGNIVRSTDASHGFNYTTSTKNTTGTNYQKPASLSQTDTTKMCSGQGIYVLTDGAPSGQHDQAKAMQNALNDSSFSCTEQAGDGGTAVATNCALAFNQKLLNSASNPAGIKIKTAVVGFGNSFSSLTSYDPKLTQAQNLAALGTIDNGAKAAAEWGIKGEGGWYSGSSSQDVVKSVNNFINNLSSEIPSVTTGSPNVPKDTLNPSVLLKNAYYPQFQPTPDKSYQLWAGNLKKYNVVNGILKDKNGNSIIDSTGKLVDNYDLWARAVVDSVKDADETTVGSTKFALIGGVKSELDLRTTANTENRKLLTNRIINGSGSTSTFVNSTSLRQVQIADLTSDYKYDANRGYLISLLGYNVDATNPSAITSTTLANASELRQVGAVMHSSPILVTNKGKITYTNYQLGSQNREDYILFGTTQGLLHVVDAVTGKEKFAFVPNEMVENQKSAFLDYKTGSNGGTAKLFYGVDGPWTTYTEYVADSSGNLTVGQGRGTQSGKQFAYGGLRMGGRSYYALDLSDMNSPKLQFQISPADQKVYYNGSSKSFAALQYMGQSWSKPTIAWVNWDKKRKRVMFVGGGYDAGGVDGDARDSNGVKQAYSGYESDVYNQANKIGGGVYMFDADTGDLLWWGSANATTALGATTYTNSPDLKYSVASEIRAEDRDSDGLTDHLYFGDLGGQVFRIDLDNNASTHDALVKAPRLLLDLHSTTAGASPRFYEMPAFSTYKQAGQTFAVVSVGSGNRSAPLNDYTVGTTGYDYDSVYNIYDKDVVAKDLFQSGYTYLTSTSKLVNLNEISQNSRVDDTTLVAPFTTNGWYYRFKSNKLQSAKVFATPIVLNYRMFVSVFDGSKAGLSGDCGAGVKGESFLQQFCMPFGQCPKSTTVECSTGDGCSIGPGLQTSTVVSTDPDPVKCDPAKEKCTDNNAPVPEDGSNNKNYCISTGSRGLTTINGIVSAGGSKMCLIPQRWYELSR